MIYYCNELAEKVLKLCKERIEELPFIPSLTVIQVGDNKASEVYIRNKMKACESVGIECRHLQYNENITEEYLIRTIRTLNKYTNGLIVQLPLPKHMNAEKVISHIDPNIDVDGFHSINLGNTMKNMPTIYPCTPKAIMRILDEMEVDVKGKNVVVLGRSNIVGKPVANMLINRGATVTVCNSSTKDLRKVCKTADVLIVAIGRPEYINSFFIKEGAVVIDVGINRRPEDNKLCGDVKIDDDMLWLADKITPVPNGVGKMTVAMLIENLVELCERRERNE